MFKHPPSYGLGSSAVLKFKESSRFPLLSSGGGRVVPQLRGDVTGQRMPVAAEMRKFVIVPKNLNWFSLTVRSKSKVKYTDIGLAVRR